MYNEENKDNFFRNILVKIILILLFIFLLVWLFPMPKLETFYDRIFAENIKTMQEAAKDYFTIDRLPENVGDKKILTLKEMLDEKLIIEFLDRDGNKCNASESYVEVVRMEDEFIFKTYLSCPTKTDYIINHFGCYDICGEACTKEKKVTEYEYYRVINYNVVDKYLCPTGYTLKGTTCIKVNSVTDTIKANKTCPTGYALNQKTNNCEKTTKTEKEADPCSALGVGYIYSGGKCIKTNVSEELAKKKCDVGYTYDINRDICVKEITTTVAAQSTCSHLPGYTLSGNSCVKTDTATGSYVTWDTNTIPTGNYTSTIRACSTRSYESSKGIDDRYITDGFTRSYVKSEIRSDCTTCAVKTYYYYKECYYVPETTTVNTNYRCADSSYTYLNGTCTKQVTDTKPVKLECANGTPSGNSCIIKSEDTKPYQYKCDNGVSSGIKCIVTTQSIQEPKWSCKTGLVSGNKCISYSTDVKAVIYKCKNADYTVAGDTCYKTSTIEDLVKAEVIYKQASKKEFKWSIETKLEGWIRTGNSREITIKK